MTISNDIGVYDVINPKIKEKIFPELGNSQITEPDIILPTSNVNDLSNPSNYTYTTTGSPLSIPIEVSNPVNTGTTSTGSTSGTTSNNISEPSATTDDTKTYVGGGTTPDSNIVVKKPTSKYYIYGLLGVLGAIVAYKLFYNKKPS
jgi:hypothetical protein